MGRKATVVRTETTTDDADEARELREKHLEVPLFSDLGDTEDERVEKLHVIREDPDEGFLGVLEGTATELDVFRQWGGSKYSIQAKNGRGRVVTRRTLKLAGDPIFLSEVFEARWRKQNGVKPKDASGEGAGAMSARELMALIETKTEAAKREADEREERRRKEDAERETKARQEEREWRERMDREKSEREARARQDERDHRERLEKERADRELRLEQQRREDDKRREDRAREDDLRREKEHERQLQSTVLAAKESQEKNQQFFTNMLAMAKAGDKAAADPMGQVTQILTIVEALKSAGGGEPQDAVQALLSRLPETLQAAGQMVGGAIREAKGLPAQGGDGGDGDDDPSAIKLTGPAAQKTRELVAFLIEKGQDPEKVLVAVADSIMGKRMNPAQLNAMREAKARQQAAEAEASKASKPARKPVRRRKPKPQPAPAAKAPVKPTAKPPGAP